MGIFHLRDKMKICGGVVGGTRGSRFCLNSKCGIKAHEKKATLQEDALYIRGGRGNHAKIFPCLPVATLPSNWDLQELTTKKKPISVWTVMMENMRKKESNIKVETVDEEEVEFEYAAGLISEAKNVFKTPAKVKTGSLFSDLVDISPSGDTPLATMSKLEDDVSTNAQNVQLLVILEEWNNVLKNIKMLEERMQKLHSHDVKYKERMTVILTEIRDQVLINQGGLQVLNAQMGFEETFNADGTNVKAWLDTLEGEIREADLRAVMFETVEEELGNRMEGVESMIEVHQEGMEELERNMNHRFAGVERSIKQAGNMVTSKRSPSWPKKLKEQGRDGGPSRQEFNALKEELRSLRETVDNREEESPITGCPTIREEQPPEEAGELGNLLKRVKDLESHLGEQGISCGTEVFASYSDVRAWVHNEGVESCGIFWDILSIMVAMEPDYMSGKQFADTEFSSTRINATVLETDLCASMQQHRPRILFATSKSGQLPKIEKGFGACSTHNEWIGGAESFRNEIAELLHGFVEGVRNVVYSEKGEWSDRGLNLALELLTAINSQWNALSSFINSFYILLTHVAKFPADKAWALVGRCVATVFTAMRTYRERVFKMRDNGTAKNRAHIIWAVLQCHRLMNEFIKVDFKGHPLIVQAVNTFMITERVDPLKVDKALTWLETLKKDKTKLASSITKIEELVAFMSHTQKDMANEIKQIKKK